MQIRSNYVLLLASACHLNNNNKEKKKNSQCRQGVICFWCNFHDKRERERERERFARETEYVGVVCLKRFGNRVCYAGSFTSGQINIIINFVFNFGLWNEITNSTLITKIIRIINDKISGPWEMKGTYGRGKSHYLIALLHFGDWAQTKCTTFAERCERRVWPGIISSCPHLHSDASLFAPVFLCHIYFEPFITRSSERRERERCVVALTSACDTWDFTSLCRRRHSRWPLHVFQRTPCNVYVYRGDGGWHFVLDLASYPSKDSSLSFRKSAPVTGAEAVNQVAHSPKWYRWERHKTTDSGRWRVRNILSSTPAAIWHRCNSCVNSFRKANCRQPNAYT